MTRVLLLVAGGILLLPGACGLALLSSWLLSLVSLRPSLPDVFWMGMLVAVLLLIGWSGILLIRKALRRPGPPPEGTPS